MKRLIGLGIVAISMLGVGGHFTDNSESYIPRPMIKPEDIIKETCVEETVSTTEVIAIKVEPITETITETAIITEVETKSYSDADLQLLAQLIEAEAGDLSSYDQKLYTGQVVINRVNSSEFPNNIHDVIYQSGQYSVTWNGMINNSPCSDSYAAAEQLLEGYCVDNRIIYQSMHKQGTVVKTFDTYDGTEYFGY